MKLLLENWRKYLNENEEDADKIFTLVSNAKGEMARELVLVLQTDINEEFFEKVFDDVFDLIRSLNVVWEPGHNNRELAFRVPLQPHTFSRRNPGISKAAATLVLTGPQADEVLLKLENLKLGLMGFLGSKKSLEAPGWFTVRYPEISTGGRRAIPHFQGRWMNPKEAPARWAAAWRDSLDETPT